jgi:exonuclease I
MPKKFWANRNSRLENNIICYDIETSGLDTKTAEPLSFAGVVVDINTLEIKEDGKFHTLIKPTDWSKVDDKALAVNKLTKEEIEREGIEQAEFFKQLTHFLQRFQKNNSKWGALYSAGYNIVGYDNQIMNRLATQYEYTEPSGGTKLFHPIHNFDLLNIVRMPFFSNNELESFTLESVCNFMGLDHSNSHTALGDVEVTWTILRRFMKWYTNNSPKWIREFKNCFVPEENETMIEAKIGNH